MNDVLDLLKRWQLDTRQVRERMYRAPTPRERERCPTGAPRPFDVLTRRGWHALWLLARGWSAVQVADALERDPHTVGDWLEDFHQAGPAGLAFEQSGGSPSSRTRGSRPS
ncbi:MAG: helix-turn-helix domain-containing protein [Bacteroidetes bacterium]|nr:helix-turn-helix domain-containing protein [Bacteroidota bacterium]